MDQYHRSVIVADEPQYQSFYPNFTGDPDSVPVPPSTSCTGKMLGVSSGGRKPPLEIEYVRDAAAKSGRYSLKIRYLPTPLYAKLGAYYFPVAQWAGVYFLNTPNAGHIGCLPGRNLTGATQIHFWARAESTTLVRFGAGQNTQSQKDKPYWTSFGDKKIPATTLTRQWQRIVIAFPSGTDMHSVLVGLYVSFNLGYENKPTTIYIDGAEFNISNLDAPRLVQSYAEGDSPRTVDTKSLPDPTQPTAMPQDCSIAASRDTRNNAVELPSSNRVTNAAYVYDQALVLLAFLARGTPDDLKRAALIAKALVVAQNNDPIFNAARAHRGCGHEFDRGRLRNAYAAGELIDANCHRVGLAGWWDRSKNRYVEDEYAAGTDTGNMAWAGLALIQADAILPSNGKHPYLEAAREIGRWIVANMRADNPLAAPVTQGEPTSGFFGGFEGFPPDFTGTDFRGCSDERFPKNRQRQVRSDWRSTEHNIDVFAFFQKLAAMADIETRESAAYWRDQAAYARKFVESMRVTDADGTVRLATGAPVPLERGTNREVVPIDVQSWALLGMASGRDFESSVDWAAKNCAAVTVPHAYGFNCHEGNGAWWEGTAQLAVALVSLGRTAQAAPLIDAIQSGQHRAGLNAGAIDAASKNGLATGLGKVWRSSSKLAKTDWLYWQDPHIGATAWYIFAMLQKNPYQIAVTTDDKHTAQTSLDPIH
jgi:hypothetical protein